MSPEMKATEEKARVNSEIEAKIDLFIGENPDVYDYYNGLTKERLVRDVMLEKIRDREDRPCRNEELIEWVQQNPEVVAKIEERMKNPMT